MTSSRFRSSPAAIALTVAGSAAPLAEPKIAPSVGTKTSAISSEAESVATRVIGRNFMNSPTTPGQNMSGRKATNVVAVAAMIGQAMRLAASV